MKALNVPEFIILLTMSVFLADVWSCSLIIRVRVVLRRTVAHCGDWVLDNLDRSHNQSELDQDYPVSHTDDHTTRSNITPWHKPFTVLYVASSPGDSSSETSQWHIVIFTRNYYCGKLWKAGISLNFFLFQTRVTYAPSNELALCKFSVAQWHRIGARNPKILGSNLKYHFSWAE